MIYVQERLQVRNLKEGMANLVGQKVIIKRTIGKAKFLEKPVLVSKAYDNYFLCDTLEEQKESYTYGDVLAKKVEVSIYNGEDYSPYLAPFTLN